MKDLPWLARPFLREDLGKEVQPGEASAGIPHALTGPS